MNKFGCNSFAQPVKVRAKKNARKLRYANKRMEQEGEAGIETNFFTPINPRRMASTWLEWSCDPRTNGRGLILSQLSPPQDPVLLDYRITRHEREDIKIIFAGKYFM